MKYSKSPSTLKKVVVITAITVSSLSFGARPTHAAENIFQRVQSSVRSRIDNFYLRWVPGVKPGKLVLKQMSESSQNVKSFESETVIDAQFTGSGFPLGTAKISVVGSTQKVGETWAAQSIQQGSKISGSASFEGVTLTADADVKMVDGVSYMMLTQVPSIPGLLIDLGAIKNTWIKSDPTTYGDTIVTPTAVEQQLSQAALYKLLEKSQVSDAWPEKKDSQNTYRLDIVVPKPALVDYLVEVNPPQGDQVASLIRQDYEAKLAMVGEIKATVWVDRSNYFPTFFEMPLEIDAKQLAETSSSFNPSAAAVDKISLKITADLRKFNQPVSITAPENAEDIQNIIPRLMGGVGTAGSAVPGTNNRQPTVGTSELPELTEWQKQQIDLYENR